MTWTWEIKSVNGRSLDLRVRVPSGGEQLEAGVRELVPQYLSRGNLQIALSVDRSQMPMSFRINRPLLEQLVAVSRELDAELPAAPPRLDGLLAVRGVLEVAEEPEPEDTSAKRSAAMLSDMQTALKQLVKVRRDEGRRLQPVVAGHVDEIERLVKAAAKSAEAQPDALRARLKAQVEELLQASPALPEERLAQEAALLATKADVREELDRLRAHIEAARGLLAEGGPVGRRLDFLCQELNREANTVCSKSAGVELTNLGLSLKTTIEKLREQVQNIE